MFAEPAKRWVKFFAKDPVCSGFVDGRPKHCDLTTLSQKFQVLPPNVQHTYQHFGNYRTHEPASLPLTSVPSANLPSVNLPSATASVTPPVPSPPTPTEQPAELPRRTTRARKTRVQPRVLSETPSATPPPDNGSISPAEIEEPENSSHIATPQIEQNLWFQGKSRPYRRPDELESIRIGARQLGKLSRSDPQGPIVYHVDFEAHEIAELVKLCNVYTKTVVPPTLESLEVLIQEEFPVLAVFKDHPNSLKGREEEDVRKFCSDLLSGGAHATGGRVLSLVQEPRRQTPAIDSRISTILFARELEGNAGFGRTRRYVNFQNDLLRALEDKLDLIAQFANCAGDIATISWVSNDNLICGTTTHSDSHNQQYNKPGNLLLCSSRQASLRAFPDHRIPRPVVASGDNSTHEMRRSQDPWLYSSVVSSDYDPVQKRAYTSSFDRTVKVWRTDDEGRLMECLATWYHDGNVNFVAAAKDGSGRVASAADVPTHAVRIYTVNEGNIAESSFESFSCSRTDADTEKWAYYPATMQWGKVDGCKHILAVGYSPRSLRGDDADIPDDKTNTGEIMLWDANNACRVPLMTATTANVFEVVWHPKRMRFLAATSPCGLNVEHSTRTQIHIFQRDLAREEHVYCEYQSLDCVASDINELTFMPNSLKDAYVTAACTNGRVYVWDTAQPGRPVHVLEHGPSLEGFEEEHVEKLDTGVKFTAWGKTPDRFYTGSSDGVVRVWNVRNRRKPYLRTLLEAPAPISSGAFSPDLDKLAIGDAAGRLYLFSLDQRDAPERRYLTMPHGRKVQIPIPFIPHAEPSAPSPYPTGAYPSPNTDTGDPMMGVVRTGEVTTAYNETSNDGGVTAARSFLESKMLVASGDRTIGVVQGPNYAQTGLYQKEAHESEDPLRPLLTTYEKLQQDSVRSDRGSRRRSLRRLRDPGPPEGRHEAAHEINASWEKGVLQALTEHDLADLANQGAILSLHDFDDSERALIYESGSEC